MNSYLSTNWSAMTLNDWIGTSATVLIFLLMAVAYIYTFKKGNRERLEAHRFIIMNEDSSEKEDN